MPERDGSASARGRPVSEDAQQRSWRIVEDAVRAIERAQRHIDQSARRLDRSLATLQRANGVFRRSRQQRRSSVRKPS